MKVRFYVDVQKNVPIELQSQYLMAYISPPGEVAHGFVRYSFDVDFPGPKAIQVPSSEPVEENPE